MRLVMAIIIMQLSLAVFGQELISFENGRLADADAINSNFTMLDEKLAQLESDLVSLSSRSPLDVSVDCDNDSAGRSALQEAITRHSTTHSASVRIFAVGTCSPIVINSGNFQILGGGGLNLNFVTGDGPSAYMMLVGRGAKVTLVAANIDASGVLNGIRNFGELNLALTSVTNAKNVNLESLAGGLVQAFGSVQLGDEDDTAVAASATSGGVLANLFIPGIFPPELTNAVLTLNGAEKVLSVRTSGVVAVNLQGSKLVATGGSVEVDSGGALFLGMADVTLSNNMSIGTNSLVEISEGKLNPEGTFSNLQTSIQISQSGGLNIDLSSGVQSEVSHFGNLFADLGATISLKGDSSDPTKLRILQTAAQQDPAPLNLLALENNSSVLISDSEIHGEVVVRSSVLKLGSAAVMTAGFSGVSVSYGGHLFVGGEQPSSLINCETGGQSWSLTTKNNLCAPNS